MQKYLEKIILLLVLINVVYVFCGILFFPLQSTDSIGIWFFKAKAIYLGKDYIFSVLFDNRFNYSHQQYPLIIPFFISVIYKFVGSVNESYALIVYPLTYLLILTTVYKTLRITASKFSAILFTYFYSMISPLVAGGGRILGGNADIFLVSILWIIIYLIYSKNRYSIYLTTLFVMIASQIKLEGVILSILILLIPVNLKKKIIFFLLSLIPFIIWQLIIRHYNFPSDQQFEINQISIIIRDFLIISREVLKELFNINNWYIYSFIIFLLIFTKEKISKVLRNIFLPFLGISLLFYLVIYLTINTDTYKEVSSSFDRVLFQLSPIIFMYFFEKMNYLLIRYRITKIK